MSIEDLAKAIPANTRLGTVPDPNPAPLTIASNADKGGTVAIVQTTHSVVELEGTREGVADHTFHLYDDFVRYLEGLTDVGEVLFLNNGATAIVQPEHRDPVKILLRLTPDPLVALVDELLEKNVGQSQKAFYAELRPLKDYIEDGEAILGQLKTINVKTDGTTEQVVGGLGNTQFKQAGQGTDFSPLPETLTFHARPLWAGVNVFPRIECLLWIDDERRGAEPGFRISCAEREMITGETADKLAADAQLRLPRWFVGRGNAVTRTRTVPKEIAASARTIPSDSGE